MTQDLPATAEDARRVLGQVEDHVIVEVLSNNPSVDELMRAALWERGDGDHEARMSQALSDREAAIVLILVRLREASQHAGG